MKLMFDAPILPSDETEMLAQALREVSVLQAVLETLAGQLMTEEQADPPHNRIDFNFVYDGDHLMSITVSRLPDRLDS